MSFDYYTISHSRYGDGFDVFGWGVYERGSVLEGQPKKVFLDAFMTLEAAKEEFPTATMSSRWMEPQVSLAHLPGADDFVRGGAYPDDWDDGY
jgi:hypothetical protein